MTGKFWPLCLQKNAYTSLWKHEVWLWGGNTQLQDNDIDMYSETPGLSKCVEE